MVMNHSIKEMVDAAVKRFSSTRFGDNEHQDNKMEEEMCTWLQKTLTSITENAVASERARIREGVGGLPWSAKIVHPEWRDEVLALTDNSL